jgi:hypothetical protein
VVTVVAAVPRELDHRAAVAFLVSAIHPPFHGDETEPAHPILAELDERRLDQIQSLGIPSSVSTIRHLPRTVTGHPPVAGERRGSARLVPSSQP